MKRERRSSIFGTLISIELILLLCLSSYFSFLSSSMTVDRGGAVSLPTPKTPINHIVIIVQENRAFDQYFGVFPGLRPNFALNMTVCELINLSQPSEGCVQPFNADSIYAKVNKNSLLHTWRPSHDAYDNGKMDGFVAAQAGHNFKPNRSSLTMAYFTNQTIPNYWDYASYYALDANFFSSILSYSWPNHLYIVAGQSGGLFGKPVNADLTFPTIIDQLNQTGVDWRYYAGNYKLAKDCQPSTGAGYLNVLPDFPAIQLSPSTCRKISNLGHLYTDLKNGFLPQVAWITPTFAESEHPGTFEGPNATLHGQLYTASIINSISSNSALWNSTAIFITWDDWGGFYDNVAPKQVDHFGYGFRVPLIVISPYVMSGIYYGSPSKTQEDFSAFLSTIEYNWNLNSLTKRDAADSPLFYMFNFSQTPRPPLLMPSSTLGVYPWQSCVQEAICQIGSLTYTTAGLYSVNFDTTSINVTANDQGDPYD